MDSTFTEANSVSDDLLNLIDQQIKYSQNNQTQIKSAIIDSVNENGSASLHIPPDTTIFSNIQNQSIYKMRVGMSVKVIKEANSSSNMWVIGVFNETSKDVAKRFIEEMGVTEISEIAKYKTVENIIVKECDGKGEGTGGSEGGGGGASGEDSNVSLLFYQFNEDLILENFATTGYITNNGQSIRFSIPLNKNTSKVKSVDVEKLEIQIIQFGKYLYGDADAKQLVISNKVTNELFSQVWISQTNFDAGYLTFYIDKKNQYNDGAVINNDACGILLNLKLMFSGLAKSTNSDGMFAAAEGVE